MAGEKTDVEQLMGIFSQFRKDDVVVAIRKAGIEFPPEVDISSPAYLPIPVPGGLPLFLPIWCFCSEPHKGIFDLFECDWLKIYEDEDAPKIRITITCTGGKVKVRYDGDDKQTETVSKNRSITRGKKCKKIELHGEVDFTKGGYVIS